MNFSCTGFIYFLSYRIPKGKTKQSSRFFEKVVGARKGRAHDEWHLVGAMTTKDGLIKNFPSSGCKLPSPSCLPLLSFVYLPCHWHHLLAVWLLMWACLPSLSSPTWNGSLPACSLSAWFISGKAWVKSYNLFKSLIFLGFPLTRVSPSLSCPASAWTSFR